MSTAKKSEIATRLRMAREAAGLTQAQVAKMLRLHRPAVSEIEAGRRSVSAEELAQLAPIYGVAVDWLTCSTGSESEADDKVILAARQLSKMKDADLDRLMRMLRMLRKGKDERDGKP